jgi:release factor glutamine methyltransferase
VSINAVLDQAAARLATAGIESPRKEARLLLAHVLGVSQESLLMGVGEANAHQRASFDALIARRCAHEPVAYLLGRREFWSLSFAVGPGVLVPRPETETLIEEALRVFPATDAPLRVLDLGTGSGCLLLSFLHERKIAQGIGVDRSADALAYARANAHALGMAERVFFVQGDWSQSRQQSFDVIFANPPYIAESEWQELPQDVRDYEPRGALLAGDDGLSAYRSLAFAIPNLLRAGGGAFIELGAGQADKVSSLFTNSGLKARTVRDLAGIERCLVLMAA